MKELKEATGLPAAASFKHVSPTGAAVAVPLTAQERVTYDVDDSALSAAALAYVRARQSDPMLGFLTNSYLHVRLAFRAFLLTLCRCSFGDFAAVSDEVRVSFLLFSLCIRSDNAATPSNRSPTLNLRHTVLSKALAPR